MTEHLAHPQFSKGISGYKAEEVDSYIEKILGTVKDLQEQNEVLEEKIAVLAESLQKYRDDEDSLREALLGAQKMGDNIIKNANNKAEITMREASVKAAHIVEEAHKKVEDEKDELLRVQTAAAEFKSKLIELYREHIELVTKIPVTEPAEPVQVPAEEPAAEPETPAQEPEEPTPEETAKPAEATEQAVLEQEEQPAEEPQREAAAETEPREEPEEETDFPALGEDIFAEFEKKKQQILNIDIGQTPDERRSKFSGLKFGNDFNLMDDDDDF